VLDIFLKDAEEKGLTVLLAGVRPDLLVALERIGITDRLPADRIFIEEEKDFSATLKAIRHAYALAAKQAGPGTAQTSRKDAAPDISEAKLAYYLV